MVRLHYNEASRQHLLAHARAYSRTLYEGSRYGAHYTAKIKCVKTGMLTKFDPRPDESERYSSRQNTLSSKVEQVQYHWALQ